MVLSELKAGVLVSFDLLPARWDELVPLQHLIEPLGAGAKVVVDKGHISQKDQSMARTDGIAKFRKNMRGNRFFLLLFGNCLGSFPRIIIESFHGSTPLS